jgi:hypothetical protein
MSRSAESVVLEAVGVNSYAELADLGTSEVIRRMDDRRPPLHPGDAFLAVLVLRAVSELRQSAEHLDSVRRRLEWATLVLAVLALAVGVGELVR